MLDHLDHLGQVRPGVEQTQGAFQSISVGALLDHRGALAIVFAHHDQSAAHHSGRGQIGQGVSRHIGAHNRLPGHCAAQRVVQAGTEHGCSRGFVGTGFDVYPQLIHEGLGLHHHIEQM